ncbi:MAG: DUF768 domain-containing protein [Bauldia sp.]|nr:DUF768 domain-containing protein [Bauldia sp.]
MSKRFQTWVKTWIEENVFPGNEDVESHAARAERLTGEIFAKAEAAGFSRFEIEEERKRIPGLVEARVSAGHQFDVDGYKLQSALAMENEDGD